MWLQGATCPRIVTKGSFSCVCSHTAVTEQQLFKEVMLQVSLKKVCL